MKSLTAEQILKKTFEHLDEMVDEKGEERRKQEEMAQKEALKNSQAKEESGCAVDEKISGKNE